MKPSCAPSPAPSPAWTHGRTRGQSRAGLHHGHSPTPSISPPHPLFPAQPLSPDEALANKLFLAEIKKEWGKMRRAAAERITEAVEAAKLRCAPAPAPALPSPPPPPLQAPCQCPAPPRGRDWSFTGVLRGCGVRVAPPDPPPNHRPCAPTERLVAALHAPGGVVDGSASPAFFVWSGFWRRLGRATCGRQTGRRPPGPGQVSCRV